MPYKMSVEHNPGCILFRFYNSSSAYQVEDAFQVILNIYRQQGIRQVLFDLSHADDSLGMLDQYQVDQKLGRRDLKNIHLAAFTSTPGPVTGPGKPLSNFMVFGSEHTAREWLSRAEAEKAGSQSASRVGNHEINNFTAGSTTLSM